MTNRSERNYRCPFCGGVSQHPEDIRNRYCGRCHVFQADIIEHLRQGLAYAAEAGKPAAYFQVTMIEWALKAITTGDRILNEMGPASPSPNVSTPPAISS